MISGAHFLLYSTDAERDRAFLRDVLQFNGIDVGGGWLIFALPPAEMAVHPAGDGSFAQRHANQDLAGVVLYLMCPDLDAFMGAMAERDVECGPVEEAEWGKATAFALPSGARIGAYQPYHKTAFE